METGASQYHQSRWLQIVLIGRNPKWTLVRIAIFIVLVFLAREYVILPIKVRGPSMLPTYAERGVNFVNRLAYLRTAPQRGDVVAIRYSGEHVMLMKRVIGLPGETVEFRGGRVFIDGRQIDEPYENNPNFPCDWDLPPEKLGSDEYFVVGDNRAMPPQNHKFGKTPRGRIVGRILLWKNLFASSPLLS